MREAGIPVGVLCSPMIPMINDSEIESLLAEAHAAGAQSAAYAMPRLPLEVAPLFEEWLQAHYPQRFAAHVLSLVRQSRGGELYDSRFGARMRGEGPFADLLAQRFAKADQTARSSITARAGTCLHRLSVRRVARMSLIYADN